MFDTGYITSEDYNAALEAPMPEDWPMNPPTQSGFSGPALTRDFAEYAHDELIRRYGANTVLQGGLSVYTTIDLERSGRGPRHRVRVQRVLARRRRP